MNYGILITMVGDIGRPDVNTMSLFYKNKRVPIAKVQVTQDFTNIDNALPTLYMTRALAENVRKQVQKRLQQISEQLAKERLDRKFYTKIVECSETTYKRHMVNFLDDDPPPVAAKPVDYVNGQFVVVDTEIGHKSQPMSFLDAMNHALKKALAVYDEVSTWQYSEMFFRMPPTSDGFDVYYGPSRERVNTRMFIVVPKE